MEGLFSIKSVFIGRIELPLPPNIPHVAVDGIHLVFHNRNTFEVHTLTPNEQQTGVLNTRFMEKYLFFFFRFFFSSIFRPENFFFFKKRLCLVFLILRISFIQKLKNNKSMISKRDSIEKYLFLLFLLPFSSSSCQFFDIVQKIFLKKKRKK